MSQPIKTKVEFDFDSLAFFTLEIQGQSIEQILDQIDMIERKVVEWGEKNYPESMGQRIKRFFGFPIYRKYGGKKTE